MADWFIATEGVKMVKISASLWPQIITAVSSAGAAFGGVWYGQWRINRREKEAAATKLASERLFFATELIFMLERYASEWRFTLLFFRVLHAPWPVHVQNPASGGVQVRSAGKFN